MTPGRSYEGRPLDGTVQHIAEAPARVRLSGTVEGEDIERATALVRQSLVDVGKVPETGAFDADIVETGASTSQKERRKILQGVIEDLCQQADQGAALGDICDDVQELGYEPAAVRSDIETWKRQGVVYTTVDDEHIPWNGHI